MDPYAICPCGSGKKVKFCCQAILPEMAKIERLQENNQHRMALQLIEKLFKDHSDNGWLVNQRAMALFHDERYAEARDTLVTFLRKHQDHPLANAMLAMVMTELEPLENCKKILHRAFLKSMAAEPRIVAALVSKLAIHHMEEGHEMAARQHLGVVLRLESEEEQSRSLMAIIEMDGDKRVPYPLRGGHPLPHSHPPSEFSAQYKKGQRLAAHACFVEAADLLQQIAAQDSASPELWETVGLMHAWDGDEKAAAAAFHTSAEHYADFEKGVDVETLAQLLERRQPDVTVAGRMRRYKVESLSRLLTRLDNEDRLSRGPLQPQHVRSGVSAMYVVLDRSLPPDGELEDLTIETVPRVIGELTLFDQSEETGQAMALISGVEGPQLDNCIQLLERIAGELVERIVSETEETDDDLVSWYDPYDLSLMEAAYYPPKTPGPVRLALQRQFVDKSLNETWMRTPQPALQGKSPAEAAGDHSLQIRLAAAVRVLDAFFDQRGIIIDKRELRNRLQLPLPQPISPSTNVDLNALSVPQLQRLELRELSDEQFHRVMHRALLVKNDNLSYRILTEFLNHRTQLASDKPGEAEQGYAGLADICGLSLRHEEALEWIEKGQAFAKSRGSFESQVLWKMRELSFRARDVNDPAFRECLLEVWNHYGAKLPSVRAQLEQFVRAIDYAPPWDQAILTPEVAGPGSGAIWTAASEQPSSEKKLWLPD